MLWFALCVIGAVVALVVTVLVVVVQRVSPSETRARHNDVAGAVFSVLGGLYAVILAFVVVNEWQAAQEAEHNTFTEANELGALYWAARAMPAEVGRDLEATTKAYAQAVVDTEWSLLGSGGYSTKATGLVYRMRDEISALPTGTAREQVMFDKTLTHIDDLAAARRQRLSESGHQVPMLLWVALALGAVVTIGFSMLFGLANTWWHLLVAIPLSLLVVFALALIAMLDQPFGGQMSVQPEAFEIFLRGLPTQR